MQAVCGYEWTSKLQRMFADMGLSKDYIQRFKEHMETDHKKLPSAPPNRLTEDIFRGGEPMFNLL